MQEKNLAEKKKKWYHMSSENLLLISMVASVILGAVLGVVLKLVKAEYSDREVIYIGFPGDIFLRMLKMLILPLIVSSLISSLARLSSQTAGKLGYLTALYFLVTTLVAVIEGIVLVLAIRPGKFATNGHANAANTVCKSLPIDTILDLFRNLFPANLVEAAFQSTRTCIYETNHTVHPTLAPNYTTTPSGWINTSLQNITTYKETIDVSPTPGMNILGLVMFSVAFGLVISIMKEEGKPLAQFFEALEGASMKLVVVVIWYGPIGILFLIAAQIVAMKDTVAQLEGLAMYMITVIAGLILHGFVVLPTVYFIFVRRNPIKHLAGVAQALFTAVGTDSSSATLPVTIRCMEENNGCDSRVARFVLPLGATVNMNGSALYEAIAAIYISQVLDKELTIGQVILVSLTATLAAVGAAGIPQAGLVTLLMVLVAVDLPPEYSALIIPVDWFLDRLRTSINVLGDTVGAASVNKLCAKELAKMGPNDGQSSNSNSTKEYYSSRDSYSPKLSEKGHENPVFKKEESKL